MNSNLFVLWKQMAMRLKKYFSIGTVFLCICGSVGVARAGLTEGIAAYDKKDYSTAFEELLPLASQGVPEAESRLGWLYANVKQDQQEAIRLYLLAANQGNALAQFELGRLYEIGKGVSQDSQVAARYYRAAAAKGNADAQYNLGGLYARGNGVSQDYPESAKLYQLAVAQGNADAQNSLAELYVEGKGVKQDYVEAVRLFRLAIEQKNQRAYANLAQLYVDGKGVAKDINEANHLAKLSGLGKCPMQIPPVMSRDALRRGISGAVVAQVVIKDGVVTEVTIESGPPIFHEAVLEAIKQYRCVFQTGSTVAKQEFRFVIAGQALFTVNYTLWWKMRDAPPAFGSRWDQLSSTQRTAVRNLFDGLKAEDEPPYPRAGFGAFLEEIRLAAARHDASGRAKLNVQIGVDGKPVTTVISGISNDRLSEIVAQAAMQTEFSTAMCAGQPCAMDFPIDVVITKFQQ